MGAHSSPARHAVGVRLLVAVVLVAAVGPAVAGSAGTAVGGADVVAQTTPAPANNTSVEHVDPATVDEGSDLGETLSWFERRIAADLERSSLELSQGQYERAEGILSDDLQDRLGRYVDVAGDAGSDRQETAEDLQDASESQSTYVDRVRDYERTYQNYTQARDRGDEAEARRQARRLDRIARNASAAGEALTGDYRQVANGTRVDLGNATASVEETVASIQTQQASVREAAFERTAISVRAVDPRTSFASPLAIEGRLTRADGQPVDVATVVITVAERAYRVPVGDNGTISLQHRPILERTATERLAVAYRPDATAPYLGANDTVAVDVRAVASDLSVDVAPETLQYRDRFTVAGEATAANASVPNLPIVVELDSQELGRTRTTEDGRFSVEGVLPAAVAAGERDLSARVAVSDRAVAQDRATAEVTVQSTDTELTLEASDGDQRRARGRLTTTDGTGLANRAVAVFVDGERVATTRTDRTGAYATAVSLPEGDADAAHDIRARFAATGTNLDPATASIRIEAAQADRWLTPLLVAGFATLLVVAAGGTWLVRRRTDDAAEEAAPAAASGDQEPGEDRRGRLPTERRLLEAAHAAHEQGEAREAIELAYAAVRTARDASPAATHWEFFSDAADSLDGDAADALRDLTRLYERAVYAESADGGGSERAVETAGDLL